MGATLDDLHRLQRIELELVGLCAKVNGKHRAVRAAKKRLREIDDAIAAKRAQLKTDQAEVDRVELDRKAREQEIAKLREALNRAKTNREYSALLTQINTDKADNAKLEDRILSMMTAVDQIKQSIRELEENRAKDAEKLKAAETAADQFEASVKEKLELLQSQRQEAAERIPAGSLRLFERVAEKNEGEAMARAVQVNPRREEFVCEGCNMGLTLEQVNALRSRDDIQTCGTCGRILFLEDRVVASK